MRQRHAAARRILILVAGIAFASPALAQTATINVVHDDPDGIVLPGQTVRITVLASFDAPPFAMLAGLSGNTINGGAQGTASNLSSWYQQGALVSHGTPVGGSVFGLSIAVTPPFFGGCGFILPQCTWNTDVHMLEFDWQADEVTTPQLAEFNFLASPTMPGLLAYLNPGGSPNWTLLPTTFTGTNLLVLPAPAVGTTLAAGALLLGRRRR